MRRRTCLIAVCLFTIFVFVFLPYIVDAAVNEKFLEWHVRDLYFYDKNDTVVKLEVTPKLFVRFTRKLTAEELTSFFSEFSILAQKPEAGDPLSFTFELDNSTKPFALLDMANKINSSGLAVASPIFLVGNIEAVVEGITVEPKIVLTAERLYERMKKYGDFSSRKTEYENGAWVFLIDEVKPPLNLLVFTNLVKNDAWVKRAYPRFKFLHDPITAFINVEPVSGTVGEIRTATLTINIFDPTMLLSENELPEFGSGLFMPIQGSPTSPQTIKYPPSYLFELIGEPIKSVVKNERKILTYKISRKFKFYALDEWTIIPQPVSFTKDGIVKEIKSSGFSLIVNSQIGNLKITDMPYPRSLVSTSKAPIVFRETKLPDVPSYWFGSFMPKKDYETIQYSKLLSLFLGFIGAAILSFTAVFNLSKILKKWEFRRSLTNEIKSIVDAAKEHNSYAEYEKSLSRILTGVVPNLSRYPNWEEIERNENIKKVFKKECLELIRKVLTELGNRHMRNFTPQWDSLDRVDNYMRAILRVASHHFFYSEGN